VPATGDAADEQLPAWSPNGRELVYISDRDENTYEVFVSAWNGAYAKRMTTSQGTKDAPTWTGDGKEIIFISSGKVFVKTRHGGMEEQLLPPVQAGTTEAAGSLGMPYVSASWSPGGDALLFIQSSDLGREGYVIEGSKASIAEAEDLRPLGIVAARNVDMAWSPVGERVAAAFIGRGGENGLLVADLKRMAAKDLYVTRGDRQGAARPVWSPDGKTIAFEMWTVKEGIAEECMGIYTISASGGTPRAIVRGDAREPAWSPDGSRLACSIFREDGGRDIRIVNADGSNAVNLTSGKGDNYNPVWSTSMPKKH
jgi:TolB protein